MTVPLLVDIASLLDQLGITPASMRIEWPLTSPARASALAPGRPGTVCGWGVRGQQVFWAPTFYGALEKAMDVIQAEYDAARAEADAWRAEHEKP